MGKKSFSGSLERKLEMTSQTTVERIRQGLSGDVKEQPTFRKLQARMPWECVVAVVENIQGESWEAFRDRQGDWGRDLALHLGRKYCGLKLSDLGARVGGLDYRSVSWAAARFVTRTAKDRAWKKALEAAERLIQNPET